MAASLDLLLLRRALGEKRSHRSARTLYGARSWAEDLDIVNELGGHTGCVNTLSWSTSGGLLASGSDDTSLNIWSYNPVDMAKPFTLNSSVSTGHHANIFSVKFMPHSSDRTVVSCAGDSEVRVFDLEYGGGNQNTAASAFSASTRSRRFNDFFANAKWFNESNTNVRVYRSHANRAKRVVTESSPFLFLTCSEDGEVRQWDLRLPSSAYPAPRGGRGLGRLRRGADDGSDSVPPPLISYKKYALDLNSISCAASQPQYIALGGAHLHCFLHDRRMLGRDLTNEAGQPGGKRPVIGMNEDEAMSEATRCVRRFAPNNKRRMNSHDHGHITACKISDANPNEMVVSWSGDHVYSFDLVKSPDARDAEARQDQAFHANRLKNRRDHKRKRKQATASSSNLTENAKPSRRLRRVSDTQEEAGHTALRVRYENGDAEEYPVSQNEQEVDVITDDPRDALFSEAQKVAERVAKSLTQLRKTLFDFSAALLDTAVNMEESSELTPHTAIFTDVLGQSRTLMPQMDEIIRTWSYPVDPDPEDVTLQNTLRRNRQASWRFVQASGCLSRVLGGTLQTSGSASGAWLNDFHHIRPAAHEGKTIRRESQFCYDFLKAILCWLEGGQESVLRAFIRPASIPPDNPRFPLNGTDTIDTFVPKLHEYLSDLADEDSPIVDLDTNRFEHDQNRHIFTSQKDAVQAFTRALAGIDLRIGQGQSEARVDMSSLTTAKRVMDKGAAARFWGVKVGRSLLLSGAEGVTFDFVRRAFGGLRLQLPTIVEAESSQEHVVLDDEERIVEAVDVVSAPSNTTLPQGTRSSATSPRPVRDSLGSSQRSDIEMNTTVMVEDAEVDDGNELDESEDEDDSDDDEAEALQALFRRRAAFGRFRDRRNVNGHASYSSHTRVYKGHCNTRTVKDVNYYGLNDEYVVSGSDDGHFFIWDRKTSKIVNILDGDGEVVNVVQGHPYEPMIACSGIDCTIKIFGVGGESRERDNAVRGIDIANPSGGMHSTLPFGRRRRRRARDDSDDDDEEEEREDNGRDQAEGEESVSKNGLHSRRAMHKIYEITSQNDAERRGGLGDTFMTEGTLARFAAALEQGQIQAIVPGQNAGGRATIVVDDNCMVM